MSALIPSDLQHHRGRYYGKYSGEVIDVADPEQRGRIKVTVPSVLPELEVWARPCFASGHFFVPPVGAKVWVEFEAGDAGFPLWVGTWYPQGSVPPEADKPEAVERVVHTPSGHVIELSDEEGEEKLVIRHKIDSSISIDKAGSILVANQNGASMLVDAEQAQVVVTSEQGHTVTLKEQGIVCVVQGGAQIVIDDAGAVKISDASSATISAQEVALDAQTVNIGASAQEPAVLGNRLLQIFTNHLHPTALGPSGPPIPLPLPPFNSTTVKVQQ